MPFGYLYGAAMNARHALYQKGVFRSHSLGAKTVSIGNLTVGGTGKTPLVAFTAETLYSAGETVCVLTRGYGRKNPKKRVVVSDGEKILADANEAGDEPLELAEKLLGKAVIIADANRASAGLWAREKFGITAFVLDDAFQHLRVKRDLDIVCIDATDPFGNGKVLPSGILREPLDNLKRADAVVITRANLIEEIENLKLQITNYTDAPIFISHNKFSNFKEINSSDKKRQTQHSALSTQHSLAFCALGNPGNFFEQLRREGFNLAATETFPDHHFYNAKDIAKLEKKAWESGAEILITTAKDAVKLGGFEIKFPVFSAENEIIFENRQDFVNLFFF